MNDYKTGCPAYLEFVSKAGVLIKGVYFVSDEDPYYIWIRDEELKPKIAKRSI